MGNDAPKAQASDLRPVLRKPSNLEQFISDVGQLNAISQALKDKNGRKFHFAIGDHSPVVWRQTVSVIVEVARVDSSVQASFSSLKLHLKSDGLKAGDSKSLNFKQFYSFYHRMIQYLDSATSVPSDAPAQPSPLLARKKLSKKPDDEDDDAECPLCMDRPAEVALAECNHAFCTKCLDEWTKRNPTCPMCRQHTAEDSEPWILTSEPDSEEIFDHLVEFLNSISTTS